MRVNRVDQSDAMRFLGGYLASRVDDLRRETWSDEPRQPLRATPAGWNTQADLRLREAGVFGGEANIAGDSQFATAAEGVAVDRGDHRLGQAFDGTGERLALAPEGQPLGRSKIHHLLDISARSKRASAGAGKDDDPD